MKSNKRDLPTIEEEYEIISENSPVTSGQHSDGLQHDGTADGVIRGPRSLGDTVVVTVDHHSRGSSSVLPGRAQSDHEVLHPAILVVETPAVKVELAGDSLGVHQHPHPGSAAALYPLQLLHQVLDGLNLCLVASNRTGSKV